MGDIPYANLEEEEGSLLSPSGTQGLGDSLTGDSLTGGGTSEQNSGDWEQIRKKMGFDEMLAITISSDDDDETCESFDISADIQAGADERFRKFEEGQKLRALRASNMTQRQKVPISVPGSAMVPISPTVERTAKGQHKLMVTRRAAGPLRSQTSESQKKVVGGNGANATELSIAMDTSSIPNNSTNTTGAADDEKELSESTLTPASIPQRRQSARLLTASHYYKGRSNLNKSKFRPATPIPSGGSFRTSHRQVKGGLLGSTPMRTGPFQESACFSPIIGMGSEVRNRLMVTQELEQHPTPRTLASAEDSTFFSGTEMASVGERRLTRSSARLTDSGNLKTLNKIPLPGSNGNANSPRCLSTAVAGSSSHHQQESPSNPRRSTRLSRRDTFEKGLRSGTNLETRRRAKKGAKTPERYVGKDPFGNYHMLKVSAVREIWEAERPGQALDEYTMRKFALKVNHYLEDFFVHHCEATVQPLGFIPFKNLHEALVSEGLIPEDMDSDALLRQMKEELPPEQWKAAEGVLIPTRSSKNGDNNDYLFK